MMKHLSTVLAASGLLVWGTAQAIPTDARRVECAAKAVELVNQLTPSERLAQLMMDAPVIDRLGVPKYHWWNEALHGIAREGLSTVFPQTIGAAASFDAPLMEKVGDVVSTEARAKHNLFSAKNYRGIYHGLTLWSPNVNLFRDPRWGRGQETMGEDPFLTGVMGSAYVRGLQGYDPKFLKTVACAKHFAVHSGPEKLRHGFNAKVSQRDIAEYYLPAFKALVMDAKVESVMSAYSEINGRSCTANKWLLTDVLRGEWGFKGHVVSDVGAVADVCTGHHHVKTLAEASKAAMEAGLDLCSEGTYAELKGEVDSGAVKSETLAKPLVNLFTARYLLGQIGREKTPWDQLGAADIATPAHRALSLKMAEESIVLISNKNGVLPLDRNKLDCLALIGPYAYDEHALIGNYNGYAACNISCVSGFASVAGPAVSVSADPEVSGELGQNGAIVACIGISPRDEGEEGTESGDGGDRARYGIADSQMKKLKEFREKYPKTPLIAVVFGGSPVDLQPIVEICDAVMLVWYPGEQGGTAIARTVFGENNPAGRLPITYPKSYADLPDIASYALEGRTYRYATKQPAYPFGYGLSYTTFAYGDEKVKVEGEGEQRMVSVSVAVKNTGKVAGDEVVQVYVKAPESAKDRRVHHLEAFTRVNLKAGETKTVTLKLPAAAFQVYDENGKSFLPKGASKIFVGGGQPGFAETVSAEVTL